MHPDPSVPDAAAPDQARRSILSHARRAGRVGFDNTFGKGRHGVSYLGDSGLLVSAISHGDLVTHGSQVEADQAKACVRAALDAGVTTFDSRLL